MNKTIKTSGSQEEFGSGAKRDMREGKGRYDLISCHALLVLATKWIDTDKLAYESAWCAVKALANWGLTRDRACLAEAFSLLYCVADDERDAGSTSGVLYPLASRLEEGAKHYESRNWEKGLPLSHLYDSTLRHLDKHLAGLTDENHIGAAMFGVAALLDHEARLDDQLFAAHVDDWPVKRKEKE